MSEHCLLHKGGNFPQRYLYRLLVSRLARAGVIISGALTPIDALKLRRG